MGRRIGVIIAAVLLLAIGVVRQSTPNKSLIIGAVDSPTTIPAVPPASPASIPRVLVPKPDLGRRPLPEPRRVPGLLGPDGRPYGRALAFRSNIPIKNGLVFVLVAGADARPGESVRKTRADSIHLLAVDPATKSGTIVGIPRDSWVNVPGRGAAKINTALSSGGPGLLVDTVRNLTGLPIHYYALTGFRGFAAIVDDLGGVDINVPRRMNDRYSGAHFEPGWHHFNGEKALAFARNRHDVANGDFSRSENHGLLMLAALAKLRAEVDDDGGLRRWLSVLGAHAELDSPASELDGLAALGRRLDPSRINNVVVPGKVGTAGGGQSVVYLGEAAARIFEDLRADAVLGAASAAPPEDEPTTTTSSPAEPSTTTTTSAEGDGFP